MGNVLTKLERDYSREVPSSHRKSYGQFFTDYRIADFMSRWVGASAKKVLDPAVGNSVFFQHITQHNRDCDMVGYEIDKTILEYFGNPTSATIIYKDYLQSSWEDRYDAIICNPPYNKFQSVINRKNILDGFFQRTGVKYDGNTNQCVLFLIKSIHQLTPRGRLAYIMPSEFLNSKYGTVLKKQLLEKKLLRAIINFDSNVEVFDNATTTCCILLIDHDNKSGILFYNLKSIEELDSIHLVSGDSNCLSVPISEIRPEEKWRKYLKHEDVIEYANLVPLSNICLASRGIATGANSFFCLSRSDIINHKLSYEQLEKCICRSADIEKVYFTNNDFNMLSKSDKKVYILNVRDDTETTDGLSQYIEYGQKEAIDKRYLPSKRRPWYSMEKKPVAPIWMSAASRGSLKFVRNLTNARTLTTFHSIFVNNKYTDETDIIFCYFLTPIAQKIIKDNRKEMGNGLDKFQPSDINEAKMLDITIISEHDRNKVLQTYDLLLKEKIDLTTCIKNLNPIFSAYLQ